MQGGVSILNEHSLVARRIIMNRYARITALTVLMLITCQGHIRAADAEDIYARTLRGTVRVVTPTGSGTAWIVDRERGLLITNEHVVSHHDHVEILFPEYDKRGRPVAESSHYRQHAKPLQAEVIDADRQHDLALIRVVDRLPNRVGALKLASGDPRPAARVHSVGNPSASGALWIYSSGTIRQVYQKEWSYADGSVRKARVIELQTPINAGDSGGPVVNDAGEVIGVVSGKAVDAVLLSWCIAVEEVRAYLEDIKALVEPTTAEAFQRRGVRALERGQTLRALTDFSKAHQLDPKLADVLVLRAMAYRIREKYDLALHDLAEAITLAPDHEGAFNVRGCVLTARGAYDEALKAFSRAIQINPQVSSIHANRGLAHAKKGELDLAVHCFDEAVRLDPQIPDWYYQRGLVLEQQGKLPQAEQDFARAVQGNPAIRTALTKHSVRALRLDNRTGKKLRVHLRYEGQTPNGELTWLPQSGEFTWDLSPGEAMVLSRDNQPILARRMRIWAESPESNTKWLQAKETDTWTAPAAGYRAAKPEVFTYTLNP
jgi:tetratricopeptide (TPR) repeat protein